MTLRAFFGQISYFSKPVYIFEKGFLKYMNGMWSLLKSFNKIPMMQHFWQANWNGLSKLFYVNLSSLFLAKLLIYCLINTMQCIRTCLHVILVSFCWSPKTKSPFTKRLQKTREIRSPQKKQRQHNHKVRQREKTQRKKCEAKLTKQQRT